MADYSTYLDEALMARISEDDEHAFAELHGRFKGILFVHAFRMLNDEDEAKDVVQELFANLWIRRKHISPNSSLSAYLYTATRNRVLDCIARKKTEEKYIQSLSDFIDEGIDATDHEIRRKELSLLIEREVSLLPSRMREVFELSRNENLSYKKIAEQLNISDTTVKKQISNALIILRKKLDTALTLLLTL